MKKTISIAICFITALTIFNSAANAATNLIVNGGFESPDVKDNGWKSFNASDVDGWEGSNIEIWDSLNGITSYEGEQHAELNADPGDSNTSFTIYQGFHTAVGQTYQISFAYRARDNSDESFLIGIVNDANNIDDNVGNDVFGAEINDHDTDKWYTFTGTFTATDDNSILYFKTITTGTYGNFIDAVSVSAVPVPAAVWLFASSIVGLVGFGRRRNG